MQSKVFVMEGTSICKKVAPSRQVSIIRKAYSGSPISRKNSDNNKTEQVAEKLNSLEYQKLAEANDPKRPPRWLSWAKDEQDELRMINYGINVGLFALILVGVADKVLTVDQDLWRGWTLLEILKRVPQDNWNLYQSVLASHPVLTKACLSGTVYALGDVTAQTYEGRRLQDYDRARIFRSGITGFVLHGPLSHYYYELTEWLFSKDCLMPSVAEGSWVPKITKIAVDQTLWGATWNGIYYISLGVLKGESPQVIKHSVTSSCLPLLKAGWRLWPFAHIFTYGFIPVQHRLLFVDMVELVWVTMLSAYAQNQRLEREKQGQPAVVQCALGGENGEGGDFAEEIIRGIEIEGTATFQHGDGISVTAEYTTTQELPSSMDIAPSPSSSYDGMDMGNRTSSESGHRVLATVPVPVNSVDSNVTQP